MFKKTSCSIQQSNNFVYQIRQVWQGWGSPEVWTMSQLWDFFLSPSLTHFHIIKFCENKKELQIARGIRLRDTSLELCLQQLENEEKLTKSWSL